MKIQSSLQKQSKVKNIKTSAANHILNFIIAILSLAIIFLAYSIVTKLQSVSLAEEETVKKNIPANIIQVEVLNGCGRTGVADKFTNFLRDNKFDVVHMGNYMSFDMDKTLIIDRTGNKANAKKAAETLGVEERNIIQQVNEDYLLDVSIIIGKDYYRLNPYK